jgi:hypothetical protein
LRKACWTAGCPDIRQSRVGDPAATAALNFGTPLRCSSLKRFGPLPHELCGILGDGVNQAADFFSNATSIPSLNVTPPTIFGN